MIDHINTVLSFTNQTLEKRIVSVCRILVYTEAWYDFTYLATSGQVV